VVVRGAAMEMEVVVVAAPWCADLVLQRLVVAGGGAGWMRVDGGAKQDGDGVTTVAGEIGGGGGCRGGWKGN